MNAIQRTISVFAAFSIVVVLIVPLHKLERIGSSTSLGISHIEVVDWVGTVIWILAIASIAFFLIFAFKEKKQ